MYNFSSFHTHVLSLLHLSFLCLLAFNLLLSALSPLWISVCSLPAGLPIHVICLKHTLSLSSLQQNIFDFFRTKLPSYLPFNVASFTQKSTALSQSSNTSSTAQTSQDFSEQRMPTANHDNSAYTARLPWAHSSSHIPRLLSQLCLAFHSHAEYARCIPEWILECTQSTEWQIWINFWGHR